MKRTALSVGVALFSACGGETIAPIAPPSASHFPTYKIAATFFDGKVMVFQSGASPITVASDTAPAEPMWSPEGSALAFARLHGRGTPGAVYSLHVWTPTGGVGPAIVSNPAPVICDRLGCFTTYASFEEGWSPDGKMLAFKAGASTIGVINADGTNSRTIPVVAFNIGTIRWSPDGSLISFISVKNGGLSADLQGVAPSAPFAQKTLAVLSDAIGSYDWSPDGKTIAATAGDHLGLFGVGNSQPFALLNITTANWAAWSPDGSKVAFSGAITDPTGSSDLFVVNKDGVGLRRVTYRSGFFWRVGWTPDGRDLLYGTTDDVLSADVEGGATLSLRIPAPVAMSVSRK